LTSNLCLEPGSGDTDYETAISKTGYGKFHYWLMFVCGWANASDAIEILCISFLLPSAECDLELTSARKGNLTLILFVGMMFGGYIWGSLGDIFGRKNILINAMLVNAAAGFASSLSQDYYVFLILRFLSGVG
jgi:VNT family MFS transporter (synaptic vesicle glycoprotein 2)